MSLIDSVAAEAAQMRKITPQSESEAAARFRARLAAERAKKRFKDFVFVTIVVGIITLAAGYYMYSQIITIVEDELEAVTK